MNQGIMISNPEELVATSQRMGKAATEISDTFNSFLGGVKDLSGCLGKNLDIVVEKLNGCSPLVAEGAEKTEEVVKRIQVYSDTLEQIQSVDIEMGGN